MRTDLQQTLSLVMTANLMIAGRPAPRYRVGEGIFRFWERYVFVEEGRGFLGRAKVKVIAEDPQGWLDQVAGQARAVRAGRLAVNRPGLSDRESSGFAGGGAQWTIEVETAGGFDLWRPAMRLGDKSRKDQKFWRSEVRCVARNGARRMTKAGGVEAASAELEAALEEVLAFAVSQRTGSFPDIFRRALGCLRGEAGHPEPGLFPGLTLPEDASRLIDAAAAAHVFGGMGSWNDFVFDGEAEAVYQRCSHRLYEAIEAALPAAVNSSAPD